MKLIKHPSTVKVNFIDTNECYVGYDCGQSCCENAYWYTSAILPAAEHPTGSDDPKNLEGFSFVRGEKPSEGSTEAEDQGGWVAFPIEKAGERRYLVLVNAHNGYYSHGFEYEIAGMKGEGTL